MEKKEAEDLENEIVKFLQDPTYPDSDKTLKGILEHVRNHKEIIKSEQERAKKDKIRRILDNSSKIHGYGNTRNRRYQSNSEDIVFTEFLIYTIIQSNIFSYHTIHNKPIDNIAEYCRQECQRVGASFNYHFDIDFRFFDEWLHQIQYHLYPGIIDSRVEQTSLPPELNRHQTQILKKHFGRGTKGAIAFAEWEFSRTWFRNNNDGLTIKPLPETWFVPGSPFAGSAYIGFQGPELLKAVINNIVQNIDSLGDEFLKNLNHNSKENVSNIDIELKWLIDNKRRRLEQHKNKFAITLALLHLNRTLEESINR